MILTHLFCHRLLIGCINTDVTFLYQFICFLCLYPTFSPSSFFPPSSPLPTLSPYYFSSPPAFLCFLLLPSFLPSLSISRYVLVLVSSLPLLPRSLPPPARCWKVSQSVSRRISASIWTGRCCRTVRLLKAPLRAASGRWPWSSRPPTHPLVTRWSTPGTSSPPSTSYPGDP